VEAQFGNEAELKRQAAMEKVLLGPPVPGVRPPDKPAASLYPKGSVGGVQLAFRLC